MVTIRSLEEGDEEKCSILGNMGFADEIEDGLPSFTPEYFIKRLPNERVKMWVAEEGDVIGFMLVTDANVEYPAQLHLITVDESKRGNHGNQI